MEVTNVFVCECKPGFNWKNVSTYKAHLKSNRHVSFDVTNQEKYHRTSITQLQIKYDKLTRDYDHLKDLYLKNILLLSCIRNSDEK